MLSELTRLPAPSRQVKLLRLAAWYKGLLNGSRTVSLLFITRQVYLQLLTLQPCSAHPQPLLHSWLPQRHCSLAMWKVSLWSGPSLWMFLAGSNLTASAALPTRRASSPLARRSRAARDSSISLSGRAKRTTLGDFPVGAGIKNSTINLTVISKRASPPPNSNMFTRIVRSLLRTQDRAVTVPVRIKKPVVRKSLVVAELAAPVVKRVVHSSSLAKSSAVVSPGPRSSTAAHARRIAAINRQRLAATSKELAAERVELQASNQVQRIAAGRAELLARKKEIQRARAPIVTSSPVVKRARCTLYNPKSRRDHIASRSASAEFAATTAQATQFAKFKRRVAGHKSS